MDHIVGCEVPEATEEQERLVTPSDKCKKLEARGRHAMGIAISIIGISATP